MKTLLMENKALAQTLKLSKFKTQRNKQPSRMEVLAETNKA
jgi:hypothetical protein